MADETSGSIDIAADRAAIMAVIADLEAYPEWSDGVKSVEVLTEYDDGRPGDARFNVESGPIKDSYVLEYEWSGDDSVSWQLTEGGVLTAMDGTYTLTDNGDGTTHVDYRLMVGLSIPMIGMIRRKAEKVIVDTAIQGLKARVEG
jgi:carbon monoxide dehydrogenase subunit G